MIATKRRSTGRTLFDNALAGGGVALGAAAGLVEGNYADIIALDCSAVPYLANDQLLDNWIFAGGAGVDCVWAGGRKQVEAGRHRQRDAINRRFLATMRELLTA